MNIIKKFIKKIYSLINCYEINNINTEETLELISKNEIKIEEYDPKLYDIDKLNRIFNKQYIEIRKK